eukprot:11174231-Lingulodinium_polyedra.AAC.1
MPLPDLLQESEEQTVLELVPVVREEPGADVHAVLGLFEQAPDGVIRLGHSYLLRLFGQGGLVDGHWLQVQAHPLLNPASLASPRQVCQQLGMHVLVVPLDAVEEAEPPGHLHPGALVLEAGQAKELDHCCLLDVLFVLPRHPSGAPIPQELGEELLEEGILGIGMGEEEIQACLGLLQAGGLLPWAMGKPESQASQKDMAPHASGRDCQLDIVPDPMRRVWSGHNAELLVEGQPPDAAVVGGGLVHGKAQDVAGLALLHLLLELLLCGGRKVLQAQATAVLHSKVQGLHLLVGLQPLLPRQCLGLASSLVRRQAAHLELESLLLHMGGGLQGVTLQDDLPEDLAGALSGPQRSPAK